MVPEKVAQGKFKPGYSRIVQALKSANNAPAICYESGPPFRQNLYRPRAVIIFIFMRIRIYSNGIEAHLTAFIGKFLANVCAGIAASLKTPQPIKSLQYDLDGETVKIQVNQTPVSLDMSHGFSRIIVLDTIRGMIRHLKMADPNGIIRIEIDMESKP